MYKHFFKRLFDFFTALIFLIILCPFFLIIAIAIKLDSKGPVVFKQKRVGKNGKVFNMHKFRTMIVDAEKGGVYSPKNDPRITKVGNFLRKTSLDETLQIIDILLGHMSFIGPRPVLTYYPCKWEEYPEIYLKRFKVRPGITGWAAVNGRKTNTVKKRFDYDNYYVDNLSFILDLKILFKTVKVVFTNEGNEDNGASEINDISDITKDIHSPEEETSNETVKNEVFEQKDNTDCD